MRKLLLTAVLVSAITITNAQNLTSKNGTPILPEAGEWSIGFDAVPVLEYFGNIFNNTSGNSISMNYQTPLTLVGKYVVDETTAYRGKLRLGFGSTTEKNSVDVFGSTTTPPETDLDEKSISHTDITLGAGLQKSRGKGRLHGIYGAEAAIMIGSGSTTYDYVNAFSATNPTPTSTDWNNPLITGGYGVMNGPRPTEDADGSTFGLSLRGFIGVEYFFAPKMSLSAEYGWGLALASTGDGELTTESWNLTTAAPDENTTTSGGSSFFGVDVDNSGGSIVLSFYF